MNNNFWSKLTKHDKLKLIYVYLLSPLLIMGTLGGNFASDMYHKTGKIVDMPCGALFGLTMMGYLPAILPPIAIRFGYFRRSLNYGLELYVSMWVSLIAFLLLIPFITGVSVGTQGFLGTLAVYCVLSYGSTGYNDIPNQKRYALTFLALIVPFIAFQIFGTPKIQGIFLIYEALFIAVMVNCHLPKTPHTNYSSSRQSSEPPKYSPPPHSENREEFTNPKQTTAIILVNIGLASIGRKTKQLNLYLTPEREAERLRAEYSFLQQVADKYRDAATRKVLAKHFMLYKETCLFIIFSVLLKNEPELHTIVKNELTNSLSDGLTMAAKVHRKEYMYSFSKAFYEQYQRTHSLGITLSFTFFSVLCYKHPELTDGAKSLELTSRDALREVYEYEIDAVKRELV